MSEQLSKQGKFDHRRKYNADGAIRLSGLGNLKVVVVEISGKFKNCLERKISFDNAEDVCVIGSVKGCRRPLPLCNCIQPSCCHIRLWSMRYYKNGICYFVCESKKEIIEEFEDKNSTILSLIDFWFIFKKHIEETSDVLEELKEEDEERMKAGESSSIQQELLSDIICPKIFSLNYNKHSRGFGNESVKSSPESDYTLSCLI